ncbi:MAG TPA: anthranilate phosphoribosyltransferase [Bacilli bacterium]
MMFSLLKEVGRGKKGARDLTYEEAVMGAGMIITGKATPAQIGAFLIAERIKMESTEEIQAFVDVCRNTSTVHPIKGGFDCAGPYDGRKRSFIATFPTAFVLASCGLPVTLHGSAPLPPKMGITLTDLLHEIGVSTGADSRNAHLAGAEKGGVLFISTEHWCPPLGGLRGIRQELGVRTVFNTVEKLLRLSEAPYMAVGVFHGTVFEKMSKLIIQLGIKRGIILQGVEGSEDLALDKRTRTYIVRDGASELYIVDPEIFELQAEMPEVEWTAALQAQTALKVLRGESEMYYHNMVLLNSALRLWIAEKVDSVEEGIYHAKYALEQGMALKKYEQWLEAVQTQHLEIS